MSTYISIRQIFKFAFAFLFFDFVILNEVKNLVDMHVGVPEILRFALDDINFFKSKNTLHSLHEYHNRLNINTSPCNVLVFYMSLMSLESEK